MKKNLIKKINSRRGAVSIFIVMSILASILTIATSSVLVIVNQKKMSQGSIESMIAYYTTEAGIEKAIYEVKNGNEPAGASVCPSPPTCAVSPSQISGDGNGDGTDDYTLYITGCLCDGSLTKVKSIGSYKTIRRSIEITF